MTTNSGNSSDKDISVPGRAAQPPASVGLARLGNLLTSDKPSVRGGSKRLCSDTRLQIVDATLPTSETIRKPTLSTIQRRCWSRAKMGVMVPGRYYFLTLTTSPKTNATIEQCWDSLRKYLKIVNPGGAHFHVLTAELNCKGVIHCIIRMARGIKRIEIKPLRSWWVEIYQAPQMKIVKVFKKADLAAYIADQRKKGAIATEMAWQPSLVSWGWSRGWLPKGFLKSFGRFWWRSRSAPPGSRDEFLYAWLIRCFADFDQVNHPPEFEGVKLF